MGYRIQLNVLADGQPPRGEISEYKETRTWGEAKKILSQHGIKVWYLDAPEPGRWQFWVPQPGACVWKYLAGARVYREPVPGRK